MEKESETSLYNTDFIQEIKQIITQARQKSYAAVNNSAMVETANGQAYRGTGTVWKRTCRLRFS